MVSLDLGSFMGLLLFIIYSYDLSSEEGKLKLLRITVEDEVQAMPS